MKKRGHWENIEVVLGEQEALGERRPGREPLQNKAA